MEIDSLPNGTAASPSPSPVASALPPSKSSHLFESLKLDCWSTNSSESPCEHRGDVNVKDHAGQIALHWSAMRGAIQVAELLLKEGAHVNATNMYGYQTTEECSARIFHSCLGPQWTRIENSVGWFIGVVESLEMGVLRISS